jgi:hypothetical protein
MSKKLSCNTALFLLILSLCACAKQAPYAGIIKEKPDFSIKEKERVTLIITPQVEKNSNQ